MKSTPKTTSEQLVIKDAVNALDLMHDGKRIGYIGYRVDEDDETKTAEISGVEINPEWRGKGFGIMLYKALAQKAKRYGISAITSNLSGMTSNDANAVWNRLMQQGYDIEEVDSVDSETGKPYFKWNLKTASNVDAEIAEHESGQ